MALAVPFMAPRITGRDAVVAALGACAEVLGTTDDAVISSTPFHAAYCDGDYKNGKRNPQEYSIQPDARLQYVSPMVVRSLLHSGRALLRLHLK